MKRKTKNTRLSKAQFNDKTRAILVASKATADALAGVLQSGSYERVTLELAEHDPVLADLVTRADFATLQPLNELVRYLSARVEN